MTDPVDSQTPGAKRFVLMGAAALAGIIVAAGLYFALDLGGRGLPKSQVSGVALIGGAFELTTHNGDVVTDQTFAGRPMLLYFGYTSCPDICPIDLHKLAKALEILGQDANALQPLFVTIDPERDDVAAMKDYVENISPRLVGLTGTPEQVAVAARAYKVYYTKTNASGEATEAEEDYWMSHSNVFYLMDGSGTFVGHFDANQSPKAMATAIRAHLS